MRIALSSIRVRSQPIFLSLYIAHQRLKLNSVEYDNPEIYHSHAAGMKCRGHFVLLPSSTSSYVANLSKIAPLLVLIMGRIYCCTRVARGSGTQANSICHLRLHVTSASECDFCFDRYFRLRPYHLTEDEASRHSPVF